MKTTILLLIAVTALSSQGHIAQETNYRPTGTLDGSKKLACTRAKPLINWDIQYDTNARFNARIGGNNWQLTTLGRREADIPRPAPRQHESD